MLATIGRGMAGPAHITDNLTLLINGTYLSNKTTFSRASSASYFDKNGTLQTAALDTPRFNYSPENGAALGYLIEESRTNLIEDSTDFGNAVVWAALDFAGSDLPEQTANAVISPDGTQNADTLTGNTAGTGRFKHGAVTTEIGETYIRSIYLKAGTNTQTKFGGFNGSANESVDLSWSAGVPTISAGTGTIEDVGNGWYRISMSFTQVSSTTNGEPIFIRPGLEGGDTSVHAWGAQVEKGSFITSYIPTSGSAATRAADVLSLSGSPLSDALNGTAGTVIASVSSFDTGTSTLLQLDDGTTDNLIAITRDGSDDSIAGTITNGGNAQMSASLGGTLPQNTSAKIALAWEVDNSVGAVAGTLGTADTSGTIPGNLQTMRLGSALSGNVWNGHIKSLKLCKNRLSDAQLQGLTS